MLPIKVLYVPSVADEPTTQITLAASAPFVRTTDENDCVVNALPAINTNVDAALPPPSSVTCPVRKIVDAELYTPAVNVMPVRSSPSPRVVAPPAGGARADSVLSAVVSADCAATARAVPTCRLPVKPPGGKPLTMVPGLNATSPSTAVAPVLEMDEPARTLMPHSATAPCVGAGVASDADAGLDVAVAVAFSAGQPG